MPPDRHVTKQTARLTRIKNLASDLSHELAHIGQGSPVARAMADSITHEAEAALAALKTK